MTSRNALTLFFVPEGMCGTWILGVGFKVAFNSRMDQQKSNCFLPCLQVEEDPTGFEAALPTTKKLQQ